MSVSGISSSLFSYPSQSVQNRIRFRQDFQQLGQDLQSGNLSASQSDFATLQQLSSQSVSSTTQSSNDPLQQAFQQLAQDLQAGNLSAAQQDYSNIQQNVQNQASQLHGHHHHHRGTAQANQVSQLFQQLGQALQTGDLSSAQQIFNTLQQDFQFTRPTQGTPEPVTTPSSVSVSA